MSATPLATWPKRSVREYFVVKMLQRRRHITKGGAAPFRALEIATQVLRLHYPWRVVGTVNSYYNNASVVPYMRAEHPGLVQGGRMSEPLRDFLVIDVQFTFEDSQGGEKHPFVVEVVFPKKAQRTRWESLIRVRWMDTAWETYGNSPGDVPIPLLAGETFVNDWEA